MRRLILIALLAPSAALAVPMQLTHTGRLFDSAGVPLINNIDVDIALYSSDTSATPLWSETLSVSFDNGYFSTTLGADEALNPLDDSVFEGGTLFIGLAIGGSPVGDRLPVHSVPFARRAGVAANVKGGVVDASEIRVGGNLVIDGNGALTNAGGTLSGLVGCAADDVPTFNGSAWSCAVPGASWSSINDVPSDLLDGDDDSLASLVCGDGELLSYSTSTQRWGCGLDLPAGTTLGLQPISTGAHFSAVDATNAMSAVGDTNTLNHNRYTDNDAIAAVTPLIPTQASDIGALPASGGTIGGDLAVTGTVQVGGASASCVAGSTEGALRWTGIALQVCTASGWANAFGTNDGSTQLQAAASCLDLNGNYPSLLDGVYWIDPNGGTSGDAFPAQCDMTNGGWTLLRTEYKSYSWRNDICGSPTDGDCAPNSVSGNTPHLLNPRASAAAMRYTDDSGVAVPSSQIDALVAGSSAINANYEAWTYDLDTCGGYPGRWMYQDGSTTDSPTAATCNGGGSGTWGSAVTAGVQPYVEDGRLFVGFNPNLASNWGFFIHFFDHGVWLK